MARMNPRISSPSKSPGPLGSTHVAGRVSIVLGFSTVMFGISAAGENAGPGLARDGDQQKGQSEKSRGWAMHWPLRGPRYSGTQARGAAAARRWKSTLSVFWFCGTRDWVQDLDTLPVCFPTELYLQSVFFDRFSLFPRMVLTLWLSCFSLPNSWVYTHVLSCLVYNVKFLKYH